MHKKRAHIVTGIDGRSHFILPIEKKILHHIQQITYRRHRRGS